MKKMGWIFAIFMLLTSSLYSQWNKPWQLSIALQPQEFDHIPVQIAGKYRMENGLGFRLGAGANYSSDKIPVDKKYFVSPMVIEEFYDNGGQILLSFDLNRKIFDFSGFMGIQYLFNIKKIKHVNGYIFSDALFSYYSLSEYEKNWENRAGPQWSKMTFDYFFLHEKYKENSTVKTWGIRVGFGLEFNLINNMSITLESSLVQNFLRKKGEESFIHVYRDAQWEGGGTDFQYIDNKVSQLKYNFVSMVGINYEF
jgi:hypothetical protein